MADDQVHSAVDILESQRLRATIPAPPEGDIDNCTYGEGYIRQSVFVCQTCDEGNAIPGGVCSACVETCHQGHDVLELWEKRAFRCDCATTQVIGDRCHFSKETRVRNEDNLYNHNFRGKYCVCNDVYDPSQTMTQCCVCEDWYHDECLDKHQARLQALEGTFTRPTDLADYELICRACRFRAPVLAHPAYASLRAQAPQGSNSTKEGVADTGASDMAPLTVIATSKEVSDDTSTAQSTMHTSQEDGVPATEAHGHSALFSQSSTLAPTPPSQQSTTKLTQGGVPEQPAPVSSTTSSPTKSLCKLEQYSDVGKAEPVFPAAGQPVPQSLTDIDVALLPQSELKPTLRLGPELYYSRRDSEDQPGWRECLCRCDRCMAGYTSLGIDFLLEEEDPWKPEEVEEENAADQMYSAMDESFTALAQSAAQDDRHKALLAASAFRQLYDGVLKPRLEEKLASGESVVTEEDVMKIFYEAKSQLDEQAAKRSRYV